MSSDARAAVEELGAKYLEAVLESDRLVKSWMKRCNNQQEIIDRYERYWKGLEHLVEDMLDLVPYYREKYHALQEIKNGKAPADASAKGTAPRVRADAPSPADDGGSSRPR